MTSEVLTPNPGRIPDRVNAELQTPETSIKPAAAVLAGVAPSIKPNAAVPASIGTLTKPAAAVPAALAPIGGGEASSQGGPEPGRAITLREGGERNAESPKERLKLFEHKLLARPEGKPPPQLDGFKKAWCFSMPEEVKDSWRILLWERTSQKEIIEKLNGDFGLQLKPENHQCLTRLREWIESQDKRESEDAIQEDEMRQAIVALGPDATLEEVRFDFLKRSYNRYRSTGDFKQGLLTMRENLRLERLWLDERKFRLLERKAGEERASKRILTPEERERRVKEIFATL